MNNGERFESVRTKELIKTEGGAANLSCITQLPASTGDRRLDKLWQKVHRECISFCRKRLAKQCMPENIYIYRVTCRSEQVGNAIIFHITAAFSDKTSRKTVFHREHRFKWRIA